jgi:hypothetical protein
MLLFLFLSLMPSRSPHAFCLSSSLSLICQWLAAQVQYVDAGWLGKKVYKGVYTYAKPLD